MKTTLDEEPILLAPVIENPLTVKGSEEDTSQYMMLSSLLAEEMVVSGFLTQRTL